MENGLRVCSYELSVKPLMTGVAFEIVIDRVTDAAGFQTASPVCETVMLHAPTSLAWMVPSRAFSTTHEPLAS
jgi:hypothetical protein